MFSLLRDHAPCGALVDVEEIVLGESIVRCKRFEWVSLVLIHIARVDGLDLVPRS